MLDQEALGRLEEAVDDYDKGHYEKAYKTFTELENMYNDDESQFYLGLMCANGHYAQKDMKVAEYWWKKSAAQRNQDAVFQLETLSISTKNSRY